MNRGNYSPNSPIQGLSSRAAVAEMANPDSRYWNVEVSIIRRRLMVSFQNDPRLNEIVEKHLPGDTGEMTWKDIYDGFAEVLAELEGK